MVAIKYKSTKRTHNATMAVVAILAVINRITISTAPIDRADPVIVSSKKVKYCSQLKKSPEYEKLPSGPNLLSMARISVNN